MEMDPIALMSDKDLFKFVDNLEADNNRLRKILTTLYYRNTIPADMLETVRAEIKK